MITKKFIIFIISFFTLINVSNAYASEGWPDNGTAINTSTSIIRIEDLTNFSCASDYSYAQLYTSEDHDMLAQGHPPPSAIECTDISSGVIELDVSGLYSMDCTDPTLWIFVANDGLSKAFADTFTCSAGATPTPTPTLTPTPTPTPAPDSDPKWSSWNYFVYQWNNTANDCQATYSKNSIYENIYIPYTQVKDNNSMNIACDLNDESVTLLGYIDGNKIPNNGSNISSAQIELRMSGAFVPNLNIQLCKVNITGDPLGISESDCFELEDTTDYSEGTLTEHTYDISSEDFEFVASHLRNLSGDYSYGLYIFTDDNPSNNPQLSVDSALIRFYNESETWINGNSASPVVADNNCDLVDIPCQVNYLINPANIDTTSVEELAQTLNEKAPFAYFIAGESALQDIIDVTEPSTNELTITFGESLPENISGIFEGFSWSPDGSITDIFDFIKNAIKVMLWFTLLIYLIKRVRGII